MIGLTYLLSLDVSFSCWFFYLLTKVENVAATALGLRDAGAGPALNRIPYIGEQAVGAFLGLALFTLYFARPHLIATWRRAFRGDRTEDDADEADELPRTAWMGLIGSSLALVGFTVALGLSVWLGAGLLDPVPAFRADVHPHPGRGRPALGPRAAGGGPRQHRQTSAAHTGAHAAEPGRLLSLLRWCDSDWRCFGQPTQLEAMKIAGSTEAAPDEPPPHDRRRAGGDPGRDALRVGGLPGHLLPLRSGQRPLWTPGGRTRGITRLRRCRAG